MQYGTAGEIVVELEGPFAGGNAAMKFGYVTMYTGSWKGAASSYTQDIQTDAISRNSIVFLHPSPEQTEILNTLGIAMISQNSGGKLAVCCLGGKPSMDMKMQITLHEVVAMGDGNETIFGNIVGAVHDKLLRLAGGKMAGSIDMSNYQLTGLKEPENDKDAATKKFVEDTVKKEYDAIAKDVSSAKSAADAAASAASNAQSTANGRALRVPFENVILRANLWEGDSAPYTQTVVLGGITRNDKPYWGVVYSSDAVKAAAQKEAFALVDRLDTQDGSVTFTCLEYKPADHIEIQLEVFR